MRNHSVDVNLPREHQVELSFRIFARLPFPHVDYRSGKHPCQEFRRGAARNWATARQIVPTPILNRAENPDMRRERGQQVQRVLFNNRVSRRAREDL